MEQLQGLLAVFNGANRSSAHKSDSKAGAQLINAIGTIESEHFGELAQRPAGLEVPTLRRYIEFRVMEELHARSCSTLVSFNTCIS